MIDRLRRRLGRLRVSQRLALLVLIPLAAVVGLALPVVSDRVGQARAAAAVAEDAQTRRQVGALLQELQRERLLSLLYLAVNNSDRLPVVRQTQATNDAIGELRTDGDPRLAPGVKRANDLLNSLRPRVLDHSVSGFVAHTVFSQAVQAVFESMPAATAAGSNAAVPPLAALDELLRANEEEARFGAGVLVRVTETAGASLVEGARVAREIFRTRFGLLARPDHQALLTTVENSQASTLVRELSDTALPPGSAGVQVVVTVGRIAAAVGTYTSLRLIVGDRIAREIVDDSAADADAVRTQALLVGGAAVILLMLVAGLAAAGARSIAVPLARLNAAAVAVASATGRELERVSDEETQAEAAPALQAVPTTGPGDVADLAAAFNQVQEGASALLARQVTTRRNVAAMFATVARRTRNLADRQLNLIDVLERQQQDPQLLERLYRLDHVATRLRRSASALLVVSGAADDPTGNPMRLADIVRAAAAEIEQFTRVHLADAVDVAAVPRAVPDLILLVAELLDNAVAYSPPPAPVDVTVTSAGGGCRIMITDVGIGMSDEQLVAENRRLVERERLDVAPTQVLGLFVIGRLARRHGLTVTLAANHPQGVIAVIDLPGQLITAPVGPTAPAPQPRGIRQEARRSTTQATSGQLVPVPERTVAAMRAVATDERFDWFRERHLLPAGQAFGREVPIESVELPRAGAVPRSAAYDQNTRDAYLNGDREPYGTLPQPLVSSGPVALPAGPSGRSADPSVAQAQAAAESAARVAAQAQAGQARAAAVQAEQARVAEQARAAQATSARPTHAAGQPGAEPGRAGLSRRVPGRNLPAGVGPVGPREPVGADPTPVDPAAARAELDAFTQGFARGADAVPGAPEPDTRQAGPMPAGDPRTPPGSPPQWPLATAVPPQRSAPPAERLTHTGRARVGEVHSAPDQNSPPADGPVPNSPAAAGHQATGTQPVDARLTRRVPGSHLAEELRLPGAVPPARSDLPLVETGTGPASSPADRDPDLEQHELDALVSGFARGATVTPPSGNGNGHTPGSASPFPPDTQPVQNGHPTNGDGNPTPHQFTNGAQAGAEPQNVERR